jgi:hypothetical protein
MAMDAEIRDLFMRTLRFRASATGMKAEKYRTDLVPHKMTECVGFDERIAFLGVYAPALVACEEKGGEGSFYTESNAHEMPDICHVRFCRRPCADAR